MGTTSCSLIADEDGSVDWRERERERKAGSLVVAAVAVVLSSSFRSRRSIVRSACTDFVKLTSLSY